MCVFLVCVLALFRASVCAFRVSELLVVRLSFVVKLFLLRCVSCEIPKFSCRVLNASFSFEFVVEFSIQVSSSSALNFRVEFWIRVFRFVVPFEFSNFVALVDFSNFVALFDFSNFTLNSSSNSISRSSCRISNSNLSSKFSFRRSIRLLESHFEFVVEFDFSNFVALVDFSNFVALVDFSNFDFSIRVSSSSPLNLSSNFKFVFRVVLISSTSRISICDFDSKLWWSSSSRIVVCEPSS